MKVAAPQEVAETVNACRKLHEEKLKDFVQANVVSSTPVHVQPALGNNVRASLCKFQGMVEKRATIDLRAVAACVGQVMEAILPQDWVSARCMLKYPAKSDWPLVGKECCVDVKTVLALLETK